MTVCTSTLVEGTAHANADLIKATIAALTRCVNTKCLFGTAVYGWYNLPQV
jgi:hypothetical protein